MKVCLIGPESAFGIGGLESLVYDEGWWNCLRNFNNIVLFIHWSRVLVGFNGLETFVYAVRSLAQSPCLDSMVWRRLSTTKVAEIATTWWLVSESSADRWIGRVKMRNLELCRFEIHESELRFKMKLLKKPWFYYSIFSELIHFLIDSILK